MKGLAKGILIKYIFWPSLTGFASWSSGKYGVGSKLFVGNLTGSGV